MYCFTGSLVLIALFQLLLLKRAISKTDTSGAMKETCTIRQEVPTFLEGQCKNFPQLFGMSFCWYRSPKDENNQPLFSTFSSEFMSEQYIRRPHVVCRTRDPNSGDFPKNGTTCLVPHQTLKVEMGRCVESMGACKGPTLTEKRHFKCTGKKISAELVKVSTSSLFKTVRAESVKPLAVVAEESTNGTSPMRLNYVSN